MTMTILITLMILMNMMIDDSNDPDYSDEYKLTPTNGATFGLLSFTQATTYVCAP